MMELCALGSGSKGNALIVSCRHEALLIDIGFSRKEALARLEKLKYDTARLKAALLTHEHDDHVKGCKLFCNSFKIPVCASAATAHVLRQKDKLPELVYEFEVGSDFEIAGFTVSPFAVDHDAKDPVGFVIRRGDCKVGIATDLGNVNVLTQKRLSDCDILILESNYDREMLMNSDRELFLKRRILGRSGHLDNLDALAALDVLLAPKTKMLMLVHLSSDCNCAQLVRNMFEQKLALMNRTDVALHILGQDSPLGPLRLAGGGSDE